MGSCTDMTSLSRDSVQLTWIESRLKERLNLERCADLGVDDGDRMVTILNRLVTWSNQIGIEAVPRHRDILLADEYGRIRHLHCPMRWVRDADRHVKEFDCANELAAKDTWNIEILEFIYIVNCQAEEGLVRAHGSIPCGCVKGSRHRRWLSRIRA